MTSEIDEDYEEGKRAMFREFEYIANRLGHKHFGVTEDDGGVKIYLSPDRSRPFAVAPTFERALAITFDRLELSQDDIDRFASEREAAS